MFKNYTLKSFLVVLLCLGCNISANAEGTYMLPRAKDLYTSGQYRPAYDLAYSIANDNPQCWEAYEIKALAAFNLKNPGEALTNINKAIKIANKDSSYNIRAKILYHLAYEKNPNNPDTQYINSLLADINIMSSRGYDKSGKIYIRNLLTTIAYANVKTIDKLKLLNAMMANDKLRYHSLFFPVYATAVKIAYDAKDSDFTQVGKTKSGMLATIRQNAKKHDNSRSYDFQNDFSDLVYYLMIGDYKNANYALLGISKNQEDNLYVSNSGNHDLYYLIKDVGEIAVQMNNFQKAGSIGIHVEHPDSFGSDYFLVVSVRKDSPADIFKIKAGDVIELSYPSDYFEDYPGMPICLRVLSGSNVSRYVTLIRE